jgi:hypothetical protein
VAHRATLKVIARKGMVDAVRGGEPDRASSASQLSTRASAW